MPLSLRRARTFVRRSGPRLGAHLGPAPSSHLATTVPRGAQRTDSTSSGTSSASVAATATGPDHCSFGPSGDGFRIGKAEQGAGKPPGGHDRQVTRRAETGRGRSVTVLPALRASSAVRLRSFPSRLPEVVLQ